MAVDIIGLNFSQLRTNIISLEEGHAIPEPSHAEWSILQRKQYIWSYTVMLKFLTGD